MALYRDSVKVDFQHAPPSFTLGPDRVICEGEHHLLSPLGENSSFDFTWQDGSKSPTYQVEREGEYSVTVRNACGESSGSVTIGKFVLDVSLTPNIITPNEDKRNDFFELRDIKEVHLQGFNRWGELMFDDPAYAQDWNGGDLPSGVYYWHARGGCAGYRKGTITIAR